MADAVVDVTGYFEGVATLNYSSPTLFANLPVSSNSIEAVSCAYTSFCMAVDIRGQYMIFNGSSWLGPQIINSLAFGHGADESLIAVSCPVDNYCVAITYIGFAVIYNQGNWFISSQLGSTSEQSASLISCTSTTFCVYLGGSNAYVFNGSNWVTYKNVDASGLAYISCISSTFCMATDANSEILEFNGSNWSQPQSIFGSPGVLPGAVSCVNTTFCMASSGGYFSIYNGSTWSTAFSSNTGSAALDCTQTNFCIAFDLSGNAYTWDGSQWSSQQVVFNDARYALYIALGCVPGFNFCVAGNYWSGDIAVFNGTWSLPQLLDSNGYATALSCYATSFCIAFSKTEDLSAQTVNAHAQIYNGTSWSPSQLIESIPSNQTNARFLRITSASCVSSSFCVAADNRGNVFNYNNSSWSGAQLVDTVSYLNSSSCLSTTFCMAVDNAGNAFLYNGTSWSSAQLVDPSGNGFTSISCSTTTFCLAVQNIASSPNYLGYAAIYKNGSWSAPVLVDNWGGFDSVDCVSSTWCIALDNWGRVMVFNGSSWSSRVTFDPGAGNGGQISCMSAGSCIVSEYTGSFFYYNSGPLTFVGLIDYAFQVGLACTGQISCLAVDSYGRYVLIT